MYRFVLIVLFVLVACVAFTQHQWYVDSLQSNEVPITIRPKEGVKKLKGYVIEIHESSIGIVSSKWFPRLKKEVIPISLVETIEWKTIEKGYRDKKFARRSSLQGAAIGLGVGTLLAILLDKSGFLTYKKKKFSFFNCTDSDEYSILPKCEYKERNYAYVIPALTGGAGYIIGWTRGADKRVHSLSILGDQSRWNAMRNQIPVVSLTLEI